MAIGPKPKKKPVKRKKLDPNATADSVRQRRINGTKEYKAKRAELGRIATKNGSSRTKDNGHVKVGAAPKKGVRATKKQSIAANRKHGGRIGGKAKRVRPIQRTRSR